MAPASAASTRLAWWRVRPALSRFLADLVANELKRQRYGAWQPPGQPWADDLAIDRDLGADSLELMVLATAVNEALQLHRSGIEDLLLARRTIGDWVEIAEAGLERFSDEITFRTSGSTGIAKACPHPLPDLLQEIDALASIVGPRRRVLAAVGSQHIYGFLFTVLLPQRLGIASSDVIDLRRHSPAGCPALFQRGDLVVGIPEFWQGIGTMLSRFPEDVIGVTSTAPCPDAVAGKMDDAGIAALLQVYGSSETAGIGWRRHYRQAYQLFSYWSFADDTDMLRREHPDGRRSTIRCQDSVQRLGDRGFSVGARHDAAVQVGGTNVFPQRVREALRRHPRVLDAAVRLMRPDEGTRLKAFVVPDRTIDNLPGLMADLTAWIDKSLSVPERPRAITFGHALPRTPEGKLCDWDVETE